MSGRIVGRTIRYCVTSFPSSGLVLNHESQTHEAPAMLQPFRNHKVPGQYERQAAPWALHSVHANRNQGVDCVWMAGFEIYEDGE